MSVADVKTQLEAALAGLSTPFDPLVAGTLDSQRAARGEYRAALRVTGAETAAVGSNLTISIATIEIDLLHRAAGSTPTQIATAEDALALLVGQVAADLFWSGLASVRPSPLEVSVESDVDRVGEVVRYTVRAAVALEG